jgi:hypothetical protein
MRGKHGARAANRMAALDSELVAELKAQVAALTRERDDARTALELAQRKTASQVGKEAAGLAARHVREAKEELTAERRAWQEERERLARVVFTAVNDHGPGLTPAGYVKIATEFGVPVGQVINDAGGSGNRVSRRITNREARAVETLRRQAAQ